LSAEILPLNQTLEFSKTVALQLWDNSYPYTPPNTIAHTDSHISSDGQWVIKKGSTQKYLYSCGYKDLSNTQIIQYAKEELFKLRSIGLNVISHWFADVGDEIITVTPHITNLKKCSTQDFQRHVAPLQKLYFQNAKETPGVFFLEDIARNRQCSKLIEGGVPFFHDVEPYLANDSLRIDGVLCYLSALAITN
jgi:hypothetical protein